MGTKFKSTLTATRETSGENSEFLLMPPQNFLHSQCLPPGRCVLRRQPRPCAGTGEWQQRALCMFCRLLICNSFRAQPYLCHLQVTFICYMFHIGHVTLSFSFLTGVTLPFSLYKAELICWSFLFEVKGRSPINFTEQWTRPAKFQLSGQFPVLLHVLKEQKHIGKCVLAAVYLSSRRCSFSNQELQMGACLQW